MQQKLSGGLHALLGPQAKLIPALVRPPVPLGDPLREGVPLPDVVAAPLGTPASGVFDDEHAAAVAAAQALIVSARRTFAVFIVCPHEGLA